MINRIRDIRRQKGLTLADVAARCTPPTTAQTIGRLETGMRSLSLIWMNRIAAALDVEPELLVRSEEARQPRFIARLTDTGAEALPSPRDAILPTELGGDSPLVALDVEAGAGEYRAGDQLWLRQHGPDHFARLLNRDILAPRPGGRFAFGRMIDRDEHRVALLPPGPGQRQIIIENPAWLAVAEMLVRKLLMRRLRVLSLSTLFPNAARPGFGLFVARQAQALARRGDVELVVINPIGLAPQPFDRFINSPAERSLPASTHDWDVEVHYPRFRTIPRLGVRWNPALIARAVLPLARRLHAAKPFDLIDAQFFYPDGPAAARIARALGLPLSIKARGSDIHLWGALPFARQQMLDAARQAGGLLAVSAALWQDMAALGMDAAKIAVHYTGLDAGLFHPLLRAEARAAIADMVPADGALLVSVGNLIPLKGQHLVIEALALLPETRLVLAGKGPEEAALRALAQRLDVAERVHFAGSVPPERLAVLLSAASAMVLPSEREGLANAWVEALACGTPLIITDVGGAREVAGSSQAGRIITRDARSIAQGVAELLQTASSQSEVAAHAARFSWEANAAQLADHFRKLACP